MVGSTEGRVGGGEVKSDGSGEKSRRHFKTELGGAEMRAVLVNGELCRVYSILVANTLVFPFSLPELDLIHYITAFGALYGNTQSHWMRCG